MATIRKNEDLEEKMKKEVKDDEVIAETTARSSKSRGDEELDYYLYSG